MWVFGYGSLMWKADFPYEQRIVGHIKGYVRRFWQASEDHRGIPGSPGRVVTIVPTGLPQDKVYGIAYKIPHLDVQRVIEQLDFREKDGYIKHTVKFYPENAEFQPFKLSIYIAGPTNPFFLGPAPLHSMAEQIASAEGPSGRNDEYLFEMAKALRELAPDVTDAHLYDLEYCVRKLTKSKNVSKL